MRPNFLTTMNPFGLATPPAWFLAQLRAYDPFFVMFPSETEPLYRLGRYGRYGTGMLRALKGIPDTAIFVAHKIWPWKSLLPQTHALHAGGWQKILLDLADYDTQDPRFASDPGAALDDAEARVELAHDRTMLADLDALNRDTYRTMKLMTGQRVGAGRRPEGAGYRPFGPVRASGMPRQSPYRPRGSGAGAMFVGRDDVPARNARPRSAPRA